MTLRRTETGMPGPSRRFALVSAIALLALLACGTSAAVAATTGAITGTVTEAGTKTALSGIEVCAYPPPPAVVSEEEPPPSEEPQCAATGAAGEYTLDVPPASYFVEFNPPLAVVGEKLVFTQRNFIAQAWQNAYTEATATKVAVAAGATVTGIDAALEVGGEVSGHVTAAATGAPVAPAIACAIEPGGGERLGDFGCGETSSAGEYTIYGLAPGSYDVIFFAPGYASQVYKGATKISEATPVNVAAGQVAGGVDAALLPRTESPAEGEPSSGPAGPTPTSGGGSGLGSGPLLGVRSRILAVGRGWADVALACHMSGTCHGRLRLYLTRHVRRGHRLVVVREPLGGRNFKLRPGRRKTFAIRLDRRALALLRAGHGRADVELSVTLGGVRAPEVLDVRLSSSRRS